MAAPIDLAEYRAADETKRREQVAKASFSPTLYDPRPSETLSAELVKVESSLYVIGRGLDTGTVSVDLAASILRLLHSDVTQAANRASKLQRKLAKAKRKAKKWK